MEEVKENKIENKVESNSDEENIKKIRNPLQEMLTRQTIMSIFMIVVIIVLFIFFVGNLGRILNFVGQLLSILTPIIIGWVLTFIMAPLYNFVIKKVNSKNNVKLKKFSKAIATIVCCLVVLLFTLGIIFLFVPQLYSSITRFASKWNVYVSRVKDTIDSLRANANNDVIRQMTTQIEASLSSLLDNQPYINYNAIASSLFTGFAISISAVVNFFIGFVVMIYSLNIKEELIYKLKRFLFAITREDIANKVLVECKYAKHVFEGFFIGKVLDSLIIGLICYVCCVIMQLPYPPLIAVIIGITNVIPIFGPFIGAIPAFILIILDEPFSLKPYIFLVFIVVLQQVDGNIIGPKILGDRTGVGSFWVLFSIILFGGLFGFIGMIVAVPLWAVVTRIFEEFIAMRLKDRDIPEIVDEYKKMELKENPVETK